MGNYNFRKDLKESKNTEQEIGLLLIKKFGANIIEYRNDSKYDILANINGVNYTFEIKEDFLSGETGNFAIEFACRGKPSGIETTEADFYIYKLHRKEGIVYTLHSTSAIKRMIKNKKYFRIASGGDKGSNTQIYLFKYNDFVKNGRIIEENVYEKENNLEVCRK